MVIRLKVHMVYKSMGLKIIKITVYRSYNGWSIHAWGLYKLLNIGVKRKGIKGLEVTKVEYLENKGWNVEVLGEIGCHKNYVL